MNQVKGENIISKGKSSELYYLKSPLKSLAQKQWFFSPFVYIKAINFSELVFWKEKMDPILFYRDKFNLKYK